MKLTTKERFELCIILVVAVALMASESIVEFIIRVCG